MSDRRPEDVIPSDGTSGRLDPTPSGHLAMFGVAAGLAVIGGVMIWDALRLHGTGGYAGVGPGLFPEVIGGGLIVLAIWTVIATLRGDTPAPAETRMGPVGWVLLGLVAQLLLLQPAGFSIATGLMFAFVTRGFGQRQLVKTIPIGIVLSFVIWVIFTQVLMLNLPAGPLERAFLGLLP